MGRVLRGEEAADEVGHVGVGEEADLCLVCGLFGMGVLSLFIWGGGGACVQKKSKKITHSSFYYNGLHSINQSVPSCTTCRAVDM